MIKISEPKLIKLRDLDLSDARFRISVSPVLEPLIHSIRKIGLLHAPVVVIREGRCVLVCGWKRVAACLKLRISRLPVFILSLTDDLEVLLFGFYENIAVRELSVLEKAEVISKALGLGMTESRLSGEMMPLLHIPPTSQYRDGFLAISRLAPPAKKMIAEKNLPFSLARTMTEFTTEALDEIIPLLRPFGQNKQKEILEDILEISKRRNLSPRKILCLPKIRAVLRAKNRSPLQKSERVRAALRKTRFPHLTSWEERFLAARKEARWPRDISLEPAPNFETDELQAAFRFEDEKEFRARLRELLDVSSQKSFPKLFLRHRPLSTTRKIRP